LRFDKGAEFYRIANLQKVWIVLDTYGDEARYFRPGQTVPFRSQGKSFHARVTNVLPQFDPVTRTMKVRLEATNPQYLLRPDMFVDVELTATMPPAITVPIDAVLDSGLKKTIFVDKGNGVFEPRQVETGSYYNDRVEITQGIMPGERIVVSGNFLIDSESRMKSPSSASSGSASQDPSCGMMVNEENAKATGLTSDYGGKTFFFCSRECKEKFDKSPRSHSVGGGSPTPMTMGKPAADIHEHHGKTPETKNHTMHDSKPGRMQMHEGMGKEGEKSVPEKNDHKSMQMKMPDGMPQERMKTMEGMPEEKNQEPMNMGNDNTKDAGNPSTDGMQSHD
jgi:Cu(I)/Ag(I) efflux system membrane fusion protein